MQHGTWRIALELQHKLNEIQQSKLACSVQFLAPFCCPKSSFQQESHRFFAFWTARSTQYRGCCLFCPWQEKLKKEQRKIGKFRLTHDQEAIRAFQVDLHELLHAGSCFHQNRDQDNLFQLDQHSESPQLENDHVWLQSNRMESHEEENDCLTSPIPSRLSCEASVIPPRGLNSDHIREGPGKGKEIQNYHPYSRLMDIFILWWCQHDQAMLPGALQWETWLYSVDGQVKSHHSPKQEVLQQHSNAHWTLPNTMGTSFCVWDHLSTCPLSPCLPLIFGMRKNEFCWGGGVVYSWRRRMRTWWPLTQDQRNANSYFCFLIILLKVFMVWFTQAEKESRFALRLSGFRPPRSSEMILFQAVVGRLLIAVVQAEQTNRHRPISNKETDEKIQLINSWGRCSITTCPFEKFLLLRPDSRQRKSLFLQEGIEGVWSSKDFLCFSCHVILVQLDTIHKLFIELQRAWDATGTEHVSFICIALNLLLNNRNWMHTC